MFKKLKETAGATWHVLRGKDKKPKKKQVVLTKEEIADHYAIKNKAKEEATKKGEPWIDTIGMDVDYDNLADGSFDLDWNDLFIARLIKAGYQGKTDADLVDQWFSAVCRNVALETYQQARADPVQSVKLDNNRREYK